MPLIPIVVDSREQRGYTFNPNVVQVVRAALPAGDYSLVGYETTVGIERKSLDDFVNTVIHDRARFAAELEKLRGYELAAVVIEADVADVTKRRYTSRAEPASVFGAWHSLIVDYGIPAYFLGTRPHAQHLVQGLLARFYTNAERDRRRTSDVIPSNPDSALDGALDPGLDPGLVLAPCALPEPVLNPPPGHGPRAD